MIDRSLTPAQPQRRTTTAFGRLLRETGPLLVLLFMFALLWALSPAFRSPTKEHTKRLTLDVTPELHRWLLAQRLDSGVTAAALLRALAHLAATDPKLLAKAVAQAEADAA